ETDNDPLLKKMKSLSLVVAIDGPSTKQTPTQPTVMLGQNVTAASNGSTSASEISEGGSWVWVVCAIVVILLLVPLILLLVPSFRQRMKFFPATASTGTSAHQEMPQTKQDVTEIQWDLAWMEMANLLDKQHYPGS
ncbi:hypothetical protein NFI96_031830, partial [Prochilodus magdalenae]